MRRASPPAGSATIGLEVVHALPGRLRFRVRGALPARVAHGMVVRELDRTGVPFALSYSPGSRRFFLRYERHADVMPALERALAAAPPREAWERIASAADHPATLVESVSVYRSAARLIVPQVARFLLVRALTPAWLRPFTTAIRVWPFLRAASGDLVRGRTSIALLDGVAIAASLAQRDLGTASTIAFLLRLGESLDEWTKEQARVSLGLLFRGTDEPAWIMRGDAEVQVAAAELAPGDRVVVRMGSRIPVDGIVESGDALVNQSAMTGESLAVSKRPGLPVYAGTVVEAGQLTVRAEHVGDQTRFSAIARIIESADALKADVASEAERLASRAVPFIFLTSGLVLVATRSWARAASVLVVDFSCALKLATPLALKSAMLEGAAHGVLFKGGKHLETLARADVFVLDKTGTVTQAKPRVAGVHGFNGYEREYVLRNAACLEEHFPHPVATAIVQQAVTEKLGHEERHSKVEYILAHGIVSALDGERIIVGSRHFVADDEGVDVDEAADLVERIAEVGHSALFFAVGGALAGVIEVEDALVPEAPEVVARLRRHGIERILMLTGDNEQAARRVGTLIGISEVHAEVLPDEKTALIRRMQEDGAVVAMLGDGVNDAAALALSDVGVSLKHGADIAREASDVLLLDGSLAALIPAVEISRLAIGRVRQTTTFAVGANAALMVLGLLGLAPASLLAVFHNASTLATCLWSLRPYLAEPASNGRRLGDKSGDGASS